MIIAAYAGCGKTTFAEKTWDSIDLVIVPFKYIVPDEYPQEEAEAGKACYGYPMNPHWPENYISAVLTAYHRYRYVVIPTVTPVIETLQRFRIPYILCSPERAAQEEYRRRYRKRGNGEVLETVFIGLWDSNIDQFEQDDYGKHLVLGEKEFLLDHKDFIEAYTEEKESVIQIDLDQSLQEHAKKVFETTGVGIEEQLRQGIIWTAENEDTLREWKEKNLMVFSEKYVGLF